MGVCRRDHEYGVCTRCPKVLRKPRVTTDCMRDDFSALLFEILAFLGVEGDTKQIFELRSELVRKEQFSNQVANLAVSGSDAY